MNSPLLHTLRNASRTLSTALALTAALGIGMSLVGGVPAHAGRRDEKDATAYTIKRVYKAGESDRYRLTTKMNIDSPQTGGAIDVLSTMVMKEMTKEAGSDGASTSISEFESASITFSGNDLDITSMMPKVITTRDKNGKSDVKMEGGNEQITSQVGEQVKQFSISAAAAFIPARPVKVGETWDLDTASLSTKEQKVKGKVTLVSVETVKGAKIAKLKTVSDITGEMETKLHSEATTLVDVATGKPVNVTTKTQGQTSGGKINIEMVLKMLGPDEKGDVKEAAKTDGAVKKP
jgi:hypothetical protein